MPLYMLERLSQLLYPPRCPYCQRVLARGESWCSLCRETLGGQDGLRDLSGRLSCAYSFLYKGSPREALLRFKFYGRKEYASAFAVRGAESVRRHLFRAEFSAVTSVPLSKTRRKERGYNQAELYARELAKLLDKPYEELLRKDSENRIQHSLGREERARNVQGVYSAQGDIIGRSILLCDDIVTSGATLRECARILWEKGAKQVYCVVIANAN